MSRFVPHVRSEPRRFEGKVFIWGTNNNRRVWRDTKIACGGADMNATTIHRESDLGRSSCS